MSHRPFGNALTLTILFSVAMLGVAEAQSKSPASTAGGIERMTQIPVEPVPQPQPMPVYSISKLRGEPTPQAVQPLSVEPLPAPDTAVTIQSITQPPASIASAGVAPAGVSAAGTVTDPKDLSSGSQVASVLPPSPAWIAQKGKSLRDILQDWAKGAGWDIAWETDNNYILQASAEFEGDFVEAAVGILEPFGMAEPPVHADFYPNRVIRVTTPTQTHE